MPTEAEATKIAATAARLTDEKLLAEIDYAINNKLTYRDARRFAWLQALNNERNERGL